MNEDREPVSAPDDPQVMDRPHRRHTPRSRVAKSAEIMGPDQALGGVGHRAAIERAVDPVLIGRRARRPETARRRQVVVALSAGGKARVEVVATGLEAVDHDTLCDVGIQRVAQTVVVEPTREVKARYLSDGMHTRVGPPSPVNGHRVPGERFDGRFERTLDGIEAVLALPAEES